MKLNDIVAYQGKVWKVSSFNRSFGTFILVSFDTTRLEVAANNPEVKYLHFSGNWPFVSIPIKSKAGRIIEIRRNGEVIPPMMSWVPGDFFRCGGTTFFNPSLCLGIGEVLVAVHERGTLTRISIKKSFGSITQRQRRKKWAPKSRPTIYDKLLQDPFGDDEL
jgi:hypothetical protein